jgi:1,4-dihydroxy-2-naphthoate octaprenyltransferase
MLFRLIALIKNIREVVSDSRALRRTMAHKHGWMSE